MNGIGDIIFGDNFEILFDHNGAVFANLAIANIICKNHGRIALDASIIIFDDDWDQIVHSVLNLNIILLNEYVFEILS